MSSSGSKGASPATSTNSNPTPPANSCCNPSCGKGAPGKLKCSACLTIFYCSVECQKKHWPQHKLMCSKGKSREMLNSSSSPTSNKTVNIPIMPPNPNPNGAMGLMGPGKEILSHQRNSDLMKEMEESKKKLQQSFIKRDFATAVQIGETTLKLANQLAVIYPPTGIPESIQIQLNLTSAYMEMKNFEMANQTIETCMDMVNKCLKSQPRHNPFIEMGALAYSTRAYVLVNQNKVADALTYIEKGMIFAETVYKSQDPRLCKSIKIMATCLEKSNRFSEAEKQLFRGYTILSVAAGLHSRDCQGFFDELLEFCMRRKDVKKADELAAKNFENLKTWDNGKKLSRAGRLFSTIWPIKDGSRQA